jgi:hypothetical protein
MTKVPKYVRYSIAICVFMFLLSLMCFHNFVIPDERIKIAKNNIYCLMTAIEAFKGTCGLNPPQSAGLNALIINPGVSVWTGPYLKPAVIPVDPWGVPYRYRLKGEVPIVDSAGPDKIFDTEDDIKSD